MAREYISMDNIRFLLYQVHCIDDLLKKPRFAHIGGRDEIDLLIQSARDLADRELFPWFREMDEKPVSYRDGKIVSHPQLKKIFRETADAGWFSATAALEEGGMQIPHMIFSTAHLLFEAANSSAQGYLGLSGGAIELILAFADRKLIETYIPPMFEGRWQGTMALTEPQAGSSLSDIVTSASPLPDGSYAISGQKIFISAGEHEACENFVHLTLARINGAPGGTKGISLFLVPRFLPDGEGSLSDNHVSCAGEFRKLGQRGYATTHLIFGEQGTTRGFLVGEANKGLACMFHMMNAARIAVGQTAVAIASAAYYASLQYASERPQGRHIEDKDLSKSQTLIINHADVRRMLLHQKAFTEGTMSLIMQCLWYYDMEKVSTGEEKEKLNLLLEILTPVAKTYPADGAVNSVSQSVQVLGGYGFTMDFDVQQYYRDIRIMSIYEGTSGIQSIDLVGRKMLMQEGRALSLLLSEIYSTMDAAGSYAGLKNYVYALNNALEGFAQVRQHLNGFIRNGELEKYLADASLVMELTGLICSGWQWLKQGMAALKSMEIQRQHGADTIFYTSKMHTLAYFFKYELPKTKALVKTLLDQEMVTIKKDPEILI